GIDLNCANTNDETALMNAAYRNHPACVELLAAHHGINPNTANKYGMTPC
ncbi:MAG: ankyrin repeat domain-containing protein, partial [Akkermansia sp.]|nr:ankyrin repeat domain-containing protein [Akkermansia sp.]